MKGKKISAVAASGAVALIFLILGFQIAVFSGNVFKFRQQAVAGVADSGVVPDGYGHISPGDVPDEDRPSASGERSAAQGTIFSSPLAAAPEPKGGPSRSPDESMAANNSRGKSPIRKALEAGSARERDYSDSRTVLAERTSKKKAETFYFDPNTVTLEELCRLGFSERQAQVILNYRGKGGKFRSEKDFAKMYVVDSSTFARLAPYIRIPKLDLNSADSEALLSLRGIGPYYASKILDFRRRLGGRFSSIDQLLEIQGFDRERLDGILDDVELR